MLTTERKRELIEQGEQAAVDAEELAFLDKPWSDLEPEEKELWYQVSESRPGTIENAVLHETTERIRTVVDVLERIRAESPAEFQTAGAEYLLEALRRHTRS